MVIRMRWPVDGREVGEVKREVSSKRKKEKWEGEKDEEKERK